MAKMTVIPLSGHLGASVEGLSLSALSDSEFAAVKQAFLDHCVLVFPQQFLGIEDHLQFAARWGEFSTSPFVKYHPEHPAVLQLSNRGKANAVTENWHFDSSFPVSYTHLTLPTNREV